jgi:hypothetical protein
MHKTTNIATIHSVPFNVTLGTAAIAIYTGHCRIFYDTGTL